MKKIIKRNPVIYQYVLAVILFCLALFISGLFNKGIIKQYFPYSSTIFLTISTWYLLKIDKKSLNTIGLNFKFKNLKFLPLGILIGSSAFLIAKYIRTLYTGEIIEINNNIDYKEILFAFYIILPTVTVEEFLFRGYLFKKTIEISSIFKANIIFAILFTLVHIFDRNVIDKLPIVIFLTITIPIGHLLFSTALLKSKSLLFPIGIHLGNNWATRHLITDSNSTESFFFISNNTDFNTWSSFIIFILIWNSFYLLITLIIWKWNIPHIQTDKYSKTIS